MHAGRVTELALHGHSQINGKTDEAAAGTELLSPDFQSPPPTPTPPPPTDRPVRRPLRVPAASRAAFPGQSPRAGLAQDGNTGIFPEASMSLALTEALDDSEFRQAAAPWCHPTPTTYQTAPASAQLRPLSLGRWLTAPLSPCTQPQCEPRHFPSPAQRD